MRFYLAAFGLFDCYTGGRGSQNNRVKPFLLSSPLDALQSSPAPIQSSRSTHALELLAEAAEQLYARLEGLPSLRQAGARATPPFRRDALPCCHNHDALTVRAASLHFTSPRRRARRTPGCVRPLSRSPPRPTPRSFLQHAGVTREQR